MPKVNWLLYRYAPSFVDVSTSVLSFSYTQGRQNYLDQYSGGTLSITLKNQSNVAQYFTFNSVWRLLDADTVDGEQYFWCQDVAFNDYPGNTGLSTITVSLVDVIARNGRNVVSNVSLAQTDTLTQLQNLWRTVPYQIGDVGGSTGAGRSTAAAITYSGSMSNYLNLIDSTEKGLVNFYGPNVGMIQRGAVAQLVSGMSFTRNATSSTAISYNAFGHDKAGLNFMNNVTVIPNGLASQTATNSASLTAYGNAAQSVSTVDATTTQALGLAQWLSNSQADPEAQTWSVSFLDLSQNSTALDIFLQSFYGLSGYLYRVWDLVYRVPGAGADSTIKVAIEGISVSATPEQTQFTVYFSPLTYYQFFTLNSSTLGILDTSRLGW
jgi:hypothetical protein